MNTRAIIERLSRGFVLRRRLPKNFGRGRIYVAPQTVGLRAWRWDVHSMDPNLFAFVDEFVKPDMCVWDIGANAGLFTFAAANRCGVKGRVISVEPDLDNARLILRTRRRLKRDRNASVDLLTVAVSGSSDRFATFEISSRARSANALSDFGGSQFGTALETRTVPLVTLDELLKFFPKPQVVKIDIEGAELSALTGASALLRDARPILLVEVETPNRPGVAEHFQRHNYHLFDADQPRGQRTRLELPAWNSIAIPQQ